jgi:hypothetical protein
MNTTRTMVGGVFLALSWAACGGGGDTSPQTSSTATTGHTGGAGTTTHTETGGAATTSSSSQGGGGSGGCSAAADCDDGFSCTIDTCTAGTCAHHIGPNSGATACPAGTFCKLGAGCVQGDVCATTDQCVQKLGGDACKANIFCDPATSVCMYATLDKDGDGHPPVVCGGDDCDDSDPNVYPGAPEVCDGKDNDCNGSIDEGASASCPAASTCQGGACTCAAASQCNGVCVDLQTDGAHCGSCANACPSGATCAAGKCQCAASATVCNGVCVDTQTDPQNCHGCGNTCATGYACLAGSCACTKTSCGGACVDTATDAQHCGNCQTACGAGASCQAGKCVCSSGLTSCNGACVDLKTDPHNCNACGTVCGACQNGTCIQCPTADLFVEMDLSGSMATALGTTTRWGESQAALDAFVQDAGSGGIGVGIGYFPVDSLGKACTTDLECDPTGFGFSTCLNGFCTGGTDSCAPADYAVPGVAMGALPGNASALVTSINAHQPTNATPQKEALEGAILYAQAWMTAHPGERVSVVLVTDGIPNECGGTTAADTASAAAAGLAGTPSVKTYVVGMGTDATLADWTQIAAAGGTTTAYLATDRASIQTALNTIRAAIKTCP